MQLDFHFVKANDLQSRVAVIPGTGVLSMRQILCGACVSWLLFAAAGLASGAEREAYTLPNGLRVRLAPDAKSQEVAVVLGARAGIAFEPAGKPHLAHVAEHLLAFGAKPGTPEADAMNRWFGMGKANGETTLSFMYFDIMTTPAELPAALRLQAARLAAPTLTRDALDREIPRTLAEVENLERSEQVFTGKFAASGFVQAALHGANQVDLKARTRSVTVDDVGAFCARTFRPDRAILVVAGAFDPAVARKEIAATLGKVPAPPRSAPQPAAKLEPGPVIATWDVATRHLLMAWPAPSPDDPDHPALSLASQVLMQRLYTDQDVMAGASFPSVTNEAPGLFLVDLPVKAGGDAAALEARVREQVGRLARTDASADFEIAQVRNALLGSLGPINVDTIPLPPSVPRVMALANIELQKLRYELAWGDLTAYVKRLSSVDGKALAAAARRRLGPLKCTVVRLQPRR
jgi:predicted Zn-dependent peptidase